MQKPAKSLGRVDVFESTSLSIHHCQDLCLGKDPVNNKN